MHCLRDYIGIYGCDSIAPESGLYINQLSGISLESIDKVSDSDQITYRQVWEDVQTRGLKKFSSTLVSYFRTKYKLNQLVSRYDFGDLVDLAETLPSHPLMSRGIIIQINPNQTDKHLDPLMAINLSNIYYYSNIPTTASFRLTDGTHQTTLWASTIALTAGWNLILKTYTTPVLSFIDHLTLTVSASFITVKTEIDSSGGGCGCGCSFSGCDCDAIVGGVTIENSFTGNVVELTPTNGHGFKGSASLQCSFDGLICANKELFSSALWYLLGSEMMIERINSPRINQFTTVDLKKAKELQAYFEAQYKEEIQLVVEGVNLDDGSCCLECNPVIAYRETLP